MKKGSELIRKSELFEKWFPRIAFFPIALLAAGGIFVVVHGLWAGDLPAIAKYSKAHVLRESNPTGYWFSFAYLSGMAGMFSYLATKLLREAGWFRASKT